MGSAVSSSSAMNWERPVGVNVLFSRQLRFTAARLASTTRQQAGTRFSGAGPARYGAQRGWVAFLSPPVEPTDCFSPLTRPPPLTLADCAGTFLPRSPRTMTPWHLRVVGQQRIWSDERACG